MKKVLFTIAALLLSYSLAMSQEKRDSLKLVNLEEIVVSSTRVGEASAIAQSNLSEDDIKKDNAARNIPFVLQTLPSVVAYSEDGSGVGNTHYRIRGTSANRINVTLNGMPVNNPETQEVYWVNMPDLSNSLKSIQVQRGIGTSSNGAASLGGSVSLQTTGARAKAYGEASSSLGSYNTFLSTIAAGTGVLKSGLSLDGRYSHITGDGYIRNGKVNHKNATINLSHFTDKQLFRLSYINGIQHTGITWEGVDPKKMSEDRKYNPAGRYKDDAGNVMYYDNETDNYYSNILQAIYSRTLTANLTLNANLSYNSGYGYYENYKTDQVLSKFGLSTQVIEGIAHDTVDIVRRKLMSNDLYVGILSVEHKKDNLSLAVGGMYSYFSGSHYGRLLWAKYNENIAHNYEWYRNTARKRDMNAFAKAEYKLINSSEQELIVSGELQYRYIDYGMRGIDDDLGDITHNNYYSFFNPKVGLSYSFLNHNRVFFSFGMANREPLRTDIKDYFKSVESVNPEKLYDYELGYNYTNKQFSLDANLYYMDYKDQLVQTGRLSDSGYKLQENVDDSYRVGIELALAYKPVKWLRLDANANLSRNKIKDYTIYYESYDNMINWEPLKEQISEYIGTTDISFSPNVLGNGVITVIPMENLSLSMTNKYVGKMYYDNTSKSENQLSGYYTANLSVAYLFDIKKYGKINLEFFVNNLFNKKYVANAWIDTYKFASGEEKIYKGLFPQAPINFMGRASISF